MEIASMNNNDKNSSNIFTNGLLWFKSLYEKLFAKIIGIAKQFKKIGKDDPRRVIHSLKVGVALTLVSLFYYFQPLYNGFGVSTMWAIMTVVVVFEFSVGATLGKGLNRGMATLLAGALGVGAHYLASASGKVVEPILLALFVFLQAFATTFIRFFPQVKARYDYGMLIFILTFCLVSISGFRVDEIVDMAHKRLSTILIGASVCVIISIFVCPVWAGEDLHKLVANNMEKLGKFLEGFGDEIFKSAEVEESKDAKKSLIEYKSVLNSKNAEETLANFARWEPGHGQFKYRHPWRQYLKIGGLIRQCACRIDALNGYINSEIKAPEEIKEKIKETSKEMSIECGKALKELSNSVRKMNLPISADEHITNAKKSAKNLNSLLKSGINNWEEINLLQVIPLATIASILTDIVICVDEIGQGVNELATLAHFKKSNNKEITTKVVEKIELSNNNIIEGSRKVHDCSSHDVVITINESNMKL
ncbi:Aluminum-activated malate transporter 2 [Capsicum baccatum]|uniref:Aluminum-activated malate transporter 2 n=1 Tax=Capsicum baccatum TaxID=33114 RepID=A0A2G2VPQ5_CAPBA|nr:Aluminum-activated malate transporter 1 [Capsicum annuum]KAF3657116.1 Aluminum-activated malate transporter 1 [Capsicum annuum]PHT34960.1 Aluminum-activated malate transporter 2 [Capsicum baccatum]